MRNHAVQCPDDRFCESDFNSSPYNGDDLSWSRNLGIDHTLRRGVKERSSELKREGRTSLHDIEVAIGISDVSDKIREEFSGTDSRYGNVDYG